MLVKRRDGDLDKAYRPCTIDELVGNEVIKNTMRNSIINNNLSNSIMFAGESGVGKTSMARILAFALNCEEGPTITPCFECEHCKAILNLNSISVCEVDGPRVGNIDFIRAKLDELLYTPLDGGRYRILIIDEAHMLSDKSKSTLLKVLEDGILNAFIFLCTDTPSKFKIPLKNRCKIFKLGRLTDIEVFTLLEDVAQFEGMEYNKDVLEYISSEVGGVPRQALTYLQQVDGEGSWTKEAASLLINYGIEEGSVELFDFFNILLKGNWKMTMSEYKKIKNINSETLRIILFGFVINNLKRADAFGRAKMFSNIADVINSPFYGAKPENELMHALFKITAIVKGENYEL